jgi:hypothetical protein
MLYAPGRRLAAGLNVRASTSIMTDGSRTLTVPRHNPDNAITMGNIVRDAGLTNDKFRELL